MSSLLYYTPGEKIDAKVQAFNSKGFSIMSDASSDVSPVLYQSVPTQGATGVTGSSTQTSISLSWTAPSGLVATGYSPITGYDIYMSTGSGYSFHQSSATSSNIAITGTITPGTTYFFIIYPKNMFGKGVGSSPFSIIAADMPGQPIPPVLSQNGSFIKISFTAPSSDGSSAITGY